MQRLPGLRDYQLRTLVSLWNWTRDGRGHTYTVLFPRQAGKNEVSAWLVSAFLLGYGRSGGGNVVVCAPTLRPQARLSFERSYHITRRRAAASGAMVSMEGNVIRCDDATATFLSGSPSANVAGHTASLLLIGDEAQDIETEWFDRQFRPMTSSTGASTVLFGTPWSGSSLLEDAVAANRRHDAALPVPAKDRWLYQRHHEYTWRDVATQNEGYGRFVALERERLGPEHPIFQSQYEVRPAAGLRRLLSSDQLRALEGAFAAAAAPAPGERCVAGLDFGGEGADGDSTVLTIARIAGERAEVVAVEAWTGAPFATQLTAVAMLAGHWRLERLVCDATGLGQPLVSELRRKLGRVVVPLAFSRGEKSELGFALQAAAGTGRLAIARDGSAGIARLWHELRLCRLDMAGQFQIGWSAPPGEHDDCVASLALCLRAFESTGGERRALGRSRA